MPLHNSAVAAMPPANSSETCNVLLRWPRSHARIVSPAAVCSERAIALSGPGTPATSNATSSYPSSTNAYDSVRALDGTGTEYAWISESPRLQGASTEQQFTVNIGAVAALSAVKLHWWYAVPGYYRIDTSLDGEEWILGFESPDGEAILPDIPIPLRSFDPISGLDGIPTGRLVRITTRSSRESRGNYRRVGLYSVEV